MGYFEQIVRFEFRQTEENDSTDAALSRGGNLTMRRYLGAAALLCVALFSTQAFSQGGFATVTGSVTDSSGAAIPLATVNARNLGTALLRSTMSDAQGRYSLPDLATGDGVAMAGG